MRTEFLGHRIPAGIEQKVAPGHTALVVVDLQNDFVHPEGYFGGSTPCQGIVAPIRQLTDAARSAGVGVHFAQIVQEADGSASSSVWISEALRRGYEPLQCISGTWGARNVDELEPQPGDRVHLKRRRSAFRGTGLEEELRAAGVETVVVTGLAANGCVEFTVRDALDLDFHPVVVLDAVANAGDPPGHSWAEHFAAFLPAENLVSSAEVRGLWAP